MVIFSGEKINFLIQLSLFYSLGTRFKLKALKPPNKFLIVSELSYNME